MTASFNHLADEIEDSIRRLDRWLERNGWAGYDPYDVRGTPFFRWLSRLPSRPELLPFLLLRKGIAVCEEKWPLLARKILLVRKRIIPKAMGLFARAYLDLYERTGEPRFRDKALLCLDWLLKHACRGYSGLCWGLPFDWQSPVFFPAGTPYAIVTAVIGDAFWKAHALLNDQRYLAACQSMGEFFLRDLRIDEMDSETLCFSFSPLDDFHVHNANLYVAQFLTRLARETGNTSCAEIGRRAANYALREQNPDGSLYYWGKGEKYHSWHHIDHYHAGFEIRMLHGMWRLTGDESFLNATRRYYRFYRDHLYSNGCIPKASPENLYPIDIHSCAEAIICNATLADEFEEARDLLPQVVGWTIADMQTSSGWFIYRITKRGSREKRARIPYIRWGQGWMMRALAAALLEARSPK